MLPRAIHTRDDILMWASSNPPSAACGRSMAEGRVQLLGGFSAVAPWGLPGWICRVTSGHGLTWLVVVLADHNGYFVGWIKEVPWAAWLGSGKRDIYAGDKPQENEREHRKSLLLAKLACVRDRSDDQPASGDQE